MRRALFLAGVLGLGLALSAMAYQTELQTVARVVLAARPAGEFPMFLQLNGSPSKLGVITSSDGSSKTNASTAVPFTIAAGQTVMVVCDVASFCIEGATASATYTSASFGAPQAAVTERYWIFNGTSTITFACAGAGALNCAVFKML